MAYRATIPNDLPPFTQIEFAVPGGMGEVPLQVLVEPEGQDPWVGVFRTLGWSQINELFVWPEGSMLLAVAKGYAHYVFVQEPQLRSEIPVFPVRHALRHESGLVVLGGFDRLCGVDGESVRWVSPQLGCDWLEDVRLSGDLVLGRGNVPSTGGWEPFSVSVIDGSTTTRWKPIT